MLYIRYIYIRINHNFHYQVSARHGSLSPRTKSVIFLKFISRPVQGMALDAIHKVYFGFFVVIFIIRSVQGMALDAIYRCICLYFSFSGLGRAPSLHGIFYFPGNGTRRYT